VKLGKTHLWNPVMILDGLRPWHPVAGMARVYQEWMKNRKTVIYLSAEPCRYERRLRRSMEEWEFPSGAIVLRKGNFIPPRDYKTKAIYPIIKNSPGHHFVLVGDSGEFDPECYGELAREFSRQVDHIYIRNISRDGPDRYERAFRSIQKKKVDLFLRPDVLEKTR